MLSIQYRKKGWIHNLVLRSTMAFGYRAADVGIGVSRGVVEDMARLAAMPARWLHVVNNPIVQRLPSDASELARVEKKWSGMLQEAFTDADRFRVAYDSPELNLDERTLVLAAAIFIDLQYFERKAQ